MSTTSMPTSLRTTLPRVIGMLAAVGLTAGCTAELITTHPVVHTEEETEVIYVERAPANVETYPREQYAGVEVYLVGGRWYRRHDNRWQTYRTEPRELGRRRAVIEERARHQKPPKDHDRDDRGHHD